MINGKTTEILQNRQHMEFIVWVWAWMKGWDQIWSVIKFVFHYFELLLTSTIPILLEFVTRYFWDKVDINS
jgi:hypothetical protein